MKRDSTCGGSFTNPWFYDEIVGIVIKTMINCATKA